MIHVIKKIHKDNFYVSGVHKIWKKRLGDGHDIVRDQVKCLIRAAACGACGVADTRPSPPTVTTWRRGSRPESNANGVPDKIWVADFTYAWAYAGFCYVSFVTDAASRRISGWKAAMSKVTPLVTGALQQALSVRRRTDSGFTANGIWNQPSTRAYSVNAGCINEVSIKPSRFKDPQARRVISKVHRTQQTVPAASVTDNATSALPTSTATPTDKSITGTEATEITPRLRGQGGSRGTRPDPKGI